MNVYLKDGIYAENLSKALISICGVKLNMDISNTDFSAICRRRNLVRRYQISRLQINS